MTRTAVVPFDFNAYHRANDKRARLVPSLECKDGFKMSVQASETHYCTPRETGQSHYTKVEVGFPSQREESLMQYAEDAERPTETVYGWVPVEVVEAIVDAHGGVK